MSDNTHTLKINIEERQYRFQIRDRFHRDNGKWGEWMNCDKNRFNEVNEYIEQGKAYQTRSLGVLKLNGSDDYLPNPTGE